MCIQYITHLHDFHSVRSTQHSHNTSNSHTYRPIDHNTHTIPILTQHNTLNLQSVHRGQFFTTMKTTTVRKLLPESWGFLCPVHTPDGSPCGLLNHLSKEAVVLCFPTNLRLPTTPQVCMREVYVGEWMNELCICQQHTFSHPNTPYASHNNKHITLSYPRVFSRLP